MCLNNLGGFVMIIFEWLFDHYDNVNVAYEHGCHLINDEPIGGLYLEQQFFFLMILVNNSNKKRRKLSWN